MSAMRTTMSSVAQCSYLRGRILAPFDVVRVRFWLAPSEDALASEEEGWRRLPSDTIPSADAGALALPALPGLTPWNGVVLLGMVLSDLLLKEVESGCAGRSEPCAIVADGDA